MRGLFKTKREKVLHQINLIEKNEKKTQNYTISRECLIFEKKTKWARMEKTNIECRINDEWEESE